MGTSPIMFNVLEYKHTVTKYKSIIHTKDSLNVLIFIIILKHNWCHMSQSYGKHPVAPGVLYVIHKHVYKNMNHENIMCQPNMIICQIVNMYKLYSITYFGYYLIALKSWKGI